MTAKAEKSEASPLAKLREPFAAHHISKLPKPSKSQTEQVKADYKTGHRCKLCGSWHHPDVVHLDYVGHAALTDRLLDCDPAWSWEPVAFREGLPAFDATGGLWIKLTVDGVSRLGYGHAATKPGADPGAREKEVIGDALRNAGMRFGAALDLWHKGDLNAADHAGDAKPPPVSEPAKPDPASNLAARADVLVGAINAAADAAALEKVWALGSGLCAVLDLKDPDKLAAISALYETRHEELASPFTKAA